MEDLIAGALLVLLAGMLIALLGVWGAAIYDATVLERRAFDRTVACEAGRGVARRKFLTTHVVCVPTPTRQDTATIMIQAKGK